MRPLLILLPILAATPALAQQRDHEEPTAIVVTGTPLAETAKRLNACLARHCAPTEDMAAALAHAENQFIAGDYEGSRATLRAAHDRNARYDKDYPVEFANLDRAYGRLTNLNGDPERGRLLQVNALDTLKGGLDSEDARVLAQRLMTGDEYVQLGRIYAADEVYRRVEKQAREAGQPRVMGMAMLRQANLFSALARPGDQTEALKRVRKLEQTSEPEIADYRAAAKVMRARLAANTGDGAGFKSAMADLGEAKLTKPVLVYSAPIDANYTPGPAVARRAPTLLGVDEDGGRSINTDPAWIDVQYSIRANGTVADVDVLRQSSNAEDAWINAVTRSVGKRRYAPLALAEGSDGMVRVERFSYVHDVGSVSRSRLPRRLDTGRSTSLDLTIDPPAERALNKGR